MAPMAPVLARTLSRRSEWSACNKITQKVHTVFIQTEADLKYTGVNILPNVLMKYQGTISSSQGRIIVAAKH